MKRILCFLFAAIMIISLCSCGKTLTDEETLNEFFTLFGEQKYDDMKKMCINDLAEWDYSTGVFGMKTAKLKTYIKAASSTDETSVYSCTFDMTPADNSFYPPDTTETQFYIDVTLQDGKWKISNFHTGT